MTTQAKASAFASVLAPITGFKLRLFALSMAERQGTAIMQIAYICAMIEPLLL